MPSFNNMNDLSNFIKQKATDIIKNEVSEKIRNVLKDYTDLLLYQAQTPKYYDRTYELLNSITVGQVKKIGNNKFLAEVFFDDSKIHPYETEGYWNQHMSTDEYKTDESKNVPYYMNYGHGGLYKQKSLNFVEESVDFLKQNYIHIKELQRRLQAIGIDCVIR